MIGLHCLPRAELRGLPCHWAGLCRKSLDLLTSVWPLSNNTRSPRLTLPFDVINIASSKDVAPLASDTKTMGPQEFLQLLDACNMGLFTKQELDVVYVLLT